MDRWMFDERNSRRPNPYFAAADITSKKRRLLQTTEEGQCRKCLRAWLPLHWQRLVCFECDRHFPRTSSFSTFPIGSFPDGHVSLNPPDLGNVPGDSHHVQLGNHQLNQSAMITISHLVSTRQPSAISATFIISRVAVGIVWNKCKHGLSNSARPEVSAAIAPRHRQG